MNILLRSVCLLLLLGAPPAAGAQTEQRLSLIHNGVEREYLLYVPPLPAAEPPGYPLVVMLHGGSRTAAKDAGLSGFSAVARREGFIVSYPEGISGHWNDGRSAAHTAAREHSDDVGFVLKLIGEISQKHKIDPSRIYAAGPSNGGMMALRLACEASQAFAAVAAVVASQPDRPCAPEKPVSVLLMNGSEDKLVPWGGGEVKTLFSRNGKVRSTPETIAFWSTHNSCPAPPVHRKLADRSPADGASVRELRYSGCAGKTAVSLYTIVGGGHTWPGKPQGRMLRAFSEKTLGKKSSDIEAAEEIWRFFRDKRR